MRQHMHTIIINITLHIRREHYDMLRKTNMEKKDDGDENRTTKKNVCVCF